MDGSERGVPPGETGRIPRGSAQTRARTFGPERQGAARQGFRLPRIRGRRGPRALRREPHPSFLPGLGGGLPPGAASSGALLGPVPAGRPRFLRDPPGGDAAWAHAPLPALRHGVRRRRRGRPWAGRGPERDLPHPRKLRAGRSGGQADLSARPERLGQEQPGRGARARARGVQPRSRGRLVPDQLDLPRGEARPRRDRLRRERGRLRRPRHLRAPRRRGDRRHPHLRDERSSDLPHPAWRAEAAPRGGRRGAAGLRPPCPGRT
mgnify:CR=1 FL=1